MNSSWIPGLMFGAVVLIWHWSFSGAASAVRYALFVAASVANYAVVLAIAEAGAPGSLNFNLFEPSVLVGSVLLPIAHGFLLGIEAKRVIVAIPVIYLVAYTVASAVTVAGPVVSIVNPIAAWQLAYLLLLRPAAIGTTSRTLSG